MTLMPLRELQRWAERIERDIAATYTHGKRPQPPVDATVTALAAWLILAFYALEWQIQLRRDGDGPPDDSGHHLGRALVELMAFGKALGEHLHH